VSQRWPLRCSQHKVLLTPADLQNYAVRLRLPSDPLDLKEKIDNSLGEQTAVLSQRPPDSVRIPSETSNTPDLNSDQPETRSTGASPTRSESMPAGWDYLVVLITIIVFTLMLAAIYVFSRS